MLVARTMTSDNAMLANSKTKLRRERLIVASCADCFNFIGAGQVEALGKRCTAWP